MGDVDDGELRIGVYFTLQRIVDRYDLDSYTVMSDGMVMTNAGQERYPLPEDFGRLVHPRGTKISGLLIYDGSSTTDLVYKIPQDFIRLERTQQGRPSTFTILGRDMLLNPLPDANGTTNYTVRGSYIREVARFKDDDPVLLHEPTVLVAMTLYQVAADRGMVQANALLVETQQALTSLVGGQARTRQQFYQSSERIGRGTT